VRCSKRGAGREIHIMFPMVSEPWEFDDAKALVEEQRQWLAERRKALPSKVYYGAMLEVPA
jgi:phosphotransferase system enzyme I (PtsP)